MRRHALARGAALLVLAQIGMTVISIVSRPGSVVADLLSLACLILSAIGLVGIVVGVKDALEQRRLKKSLRQQK